MIFNDKESGYTGRQDFDTASAKLKDQVTDIKGMLAAMKLPDMGKPAMVVQNAPTEADLSRLLGHEFGSFGQERSSSVGLDQQRGGPSGVVYSRSLSK